MKDRGRNGHPGDRTPAGKRELVGGDLRGRRLEAPAGREIRPTSDRTREAIFNILAHADWAPEIEGARVLDAFCGTGALGLEALSRGAGHAVFMDQGREALDLVRRNIAALGVGDRSAVLRARRRTSAACAGGLYAGVPRSAVWAGAGLDGADSADRARLVRFRRRRLLSRRGLKIRWKWIWSGSMSGSMAIRGSTFCASPEIASWSCWAGPSS